jgi:hypothetical protein
MKAILQIVDTVNKFNLFIRTTAGKVSIIVIAMAAQVPGLALYIHNMFVMKTGGEPVGKLEWLIPVASSMVFEFVVYALIMNNAKAWAWLFALGGGFMSFTTWSKMLLVNGTFDGDTGYWMFFGFVAIISVFPVLVIAIFSHMISDDMEKYMLKIAESEKTIFYESSNSIHDEVKAYFDKPKKPKLSKKTIEEILNEN